MNAFTRKPDVSKFLRALGANRARSLTVSARNQRLNPVQTDKLRLFTMEQRSGNR